MQAAEPLSGGSSSHASFHLRAWPRWPSAPRALLRPRRPGADRPGRPDHRPGGFVPGRTGRSGLRPPPGGRPGRRGAGSPPAIPALRGGGDRGRVAGPRPGARLPVTPAALAPGAADPPGRRDPTGPRRAESGGARSGHGLRLRRPPPNRPGAGAPVGPDVPVPGRAGPRPDADPGRRPGAGVAALRLETGGPLPTANRPTASGRSRPGPAATRPARRRGRPWPRSCWPPEPGRFQALEGAEIEVARPAGAEPWRAGKLPFGDRPDPV